MLKMPLARAPGWFPTPRSRMASLDPADKALIIKRLKRAQGQMGGIIRMLEEERACRDVVTQLAAVSKAIDRAGFALIASGLKACASAESAAAATSSDGGGSSANSDTHSSAGSGAGSGTGGTPTQQPCLTVAELEKLFLSLA